MKRIKVYRSCFRLLQHLLFWSGCIYLFQLIFESGTGNASFSLIDYIYSAFFNLSFLPYVYLHMYGVVPVFLQKQRYVRYALSLVGLVLLGTLSNWALFEFGTDFFGFYFISYFEWFELLGFVVLYLAVSTLLKFSKSWFYLQRLQREMAQQEQMHAESMLFALRSQVNPHFLFNALNSIYSLVLMKDENASEAILKLSEVLRYSLYEAKRETVKLTEEIQLVRTYVGLQQMRFDDSLELTFETKGDFENFRVAPLLFLPLVENAFKHGAKAATKNAFVHIRAERKGDFLYFEIENNKGKTDEPEQMKSGGVGLENLGQRLQLTYKNSHEMQILDDEVFAVRLKLPNLTVNEDAVSYY
ncbi:MAG: histidine kinase [Cytophagales bacterium]|nr:histidine kinase [Cytophagales bacterium]